MRPIPLLIVLLAISTFTSACDDLGEPRTLPAPSFDAQRLFPGLSESDRPSATESAAFEERIAGMMEDDQRPEETTTRAVQLVPLGGSLVTEIPEDHDSWRWSREDGRTLISMTPPGGDPEVLILTRDYPMAAAVSPSQQFRNFILDVDPTLGPGINVGQLFQQAQMGQLPIDQLTDTNGDIPTDDLLDLLAGADTLTGGRGIGYHSAPKSFSGWRWVGQNRASVTLRIATSRGNWGPQPPHPPGLDPATLQRLVDTSAEAPTTSTGPMGVDLGETIGLDLDGALDTLGGVGVGGTNNNLPAEASPARIASTRPDMDRITIPNRPAQLYVGQVELSPTRGAYIVILCAAQGDCPHAPQLASFLDLVHPEERPPSGRQGDFTTHAESLGLHFH